MYHIITGVASDFVLYLSPLSAPPMRFRFLIFALAAIAAAPFTAHAASIGFASSGILFSAEPSFAGTAIKVYSVVVNNQYAKLNATVAFLDNNQEFGRATVEVLLEEARQVQSSWTPTAGQHVVVAKFVSATATDAQGVAKKLSQSEIDSVAAPVSRTVTIDSDSDKDGIGNQDEIHTYRTSPLNKDSDGDGLSDYDEIFKYKTDPNKADTDGDGMNDGDEIKVGRNPLVPDAPPPPVATPPAVLPAVPFQPSTAAPATNAPKPTQKKKAVPRAPLPTGTPTITATTTTATTTSSTEPFLTTPPVPDQMPPSDDSGKKWVTVLGIVALLLAIAAAVSGALAYREQRRY